MVANDMRQLAGDIRSFREPLKLAIQGVLAPSIRKNFDEGGRPAWPELADATIKRKKRNKDKILVESGKLRRVASQYNSWTVTTNSATLDVLPGAEYGSFHETGTKNMPERPFSTIQSDDADEVELVFEIWLRRRARARNF